MKLIIATMMAIFLLVMLSINCQALAAEPGKNRQAIARAGSQTAITGSAEYFTGNVRVAPLFSATDTAPFSGAYVTFGGGSNRPASSDVQIFMHHAN